MSHIRLAAALLAAGSAVFVPGAATGTPPTPTPTPRPRLSGGFGRTPVATSEADGQSMADVVRAASVARRRREAKTVAITNDSLVKDTKKGRVSTSQVKPEAPAARPPVKTDAPAAAAPIETPAAAEEALWRDRAHAARKRVEDLKAQVSQLEIESKQLENDFYRWDDGQYRDRVIKPAWDKKREELETARKQLGQAETELAELPEKARRAGALPGWLRE